MSSSGRALVRAVRSGTDWSRHVAYRPVRSLGSTETIDQLLATPTWSVRSLLPPQASEESSGMSADRSASNEESEVTEPTSVTKSRTADDEITPSKLHHLLRLSALPLPKNAEEETRLLHDLRSQVHFVRHLQSVDTSGVTELVAIRDETDAAREERQINLADVQPWLDLEEHVGNNGTVRRRKTNIAALEQQKDNHSTENRDPKTKKLVADDDRRLFKWDTLPPSGDEEGRRWGKYYVVRRGKKTPASTPVTDMLHSHTAVAQNTATQDESQESSSMETAPLSNSALQDTEKPLAKDHSRSPVSPHPQVTPSASEQPSPTSPQQPTRQQQLRAARAASYEAILKRASAQDTYHLRNSSRLVPGSTRPNPDGRTKGGTAEKPWERLPY